MQKHTRAIDLHTCDTDIMKPFIPEGTLQKVI